MTQENSKQQSSTDHEQQGWHGQGCGRHGRERQLWVSTCLSENLGPGERRSLKLFEVSPSLLATQAGIWEGVLLGQEEPDNPVPATMGKARAPEPACDGLCQRTAGVLMAGSASSPAGKEERPLPPCPPMGPAVMPQQGPGIVSQ